jgi:hypothetical protein
MATYPSLVMAQQLAEAIKVRLNLATVVSQDVNGDPTVAIGPGTAGSQSAFVRIKVRNAPLGFDIVGNNQPQYGKPHVAQIVIEAPNGTGVEPTGSAALTVALVGELARVGVRLELYKSATGVAPAIAGITGNPVGTYEDLFNAIASTM